MISLKASVGRVLSTWIGANDWSSESTNTLPPPYLSDARLIELRNTFPVAESESRRRTMPPHCPPCTAGPTPSLSPPSVSSW